MSERVLQPLTDRENALLAIGRRLQAEGYSFTAVTPETHRRVLARDAGASSHRDVFGWNRPFVRDAIDPSLIELLEIAGALRGEGSQWVSTVRYATYGPLICLHSGFPTLEPQSVFFGPDTYRFLRLVEEVAGALPMARRIADIGTGSGIAAILLARRFGEAVVLALDNNREALRFTLVNAALNDVNNVRAVDSDVVGAIGGELDLIVSNPPYLIDPARRRYRHGGDRTGYELSLRIVQEGVQKLSVDGLLVLYTGVPIIEGRDTFRSAVDGALRNTRWNVLRYREIDPDVFGEELDQPGYGCAERISVVGVVVGARNALD